MTFRIKKIVLLCIFLFSTYLTYSQIPPPIPGQKTRFLPIRLPNEDTLKRIVATNAEVDQFLAQRPNYGDTIGKTTAIRKIIVNAKTGLYFGFYGNYDEALLAHEKLYAIRTAIDNLLVIKHLRKIYLQKNGKTIKSFNISLGPHPVGQKEREGDGKTPEGIYTIDWTKWTGNTPSYHISYPNAQDIARAKKKNVIPGSFIMIHHTTKGVKKSKDWTNGCIALSNSDFEIFRKMVFQDTRIEIIK